MYFISHFQTHLARHVETMKNIKETPELLTLKKSKSKYVHIMQSSSRFVNLHGIGSVKYPSNSSFVWVHVRVSPSFGKEESSKCAFRILNLVLEFIL